ncbi:hypothetical protein BAUCODRAFT_389608 [Baudoinia panamericana UAMH 10762]|uniref:Rhodopsin domain-containing protein n=1 Tax=Baudoinia panamericana (strain UAMH 10762) TaxID=717646 RepID=M2MQJ7_BAUPA|nr:uncharacterized protein BAUCODRAFT_389608 [Baudoinia panamericana UAMH 10762]EMC99066.1 hypothetical protein BAUCODRAFT_389608 [Baudoinia panamericana UAMH 10762]
MSGTPIQNSHVWATDVPNRSPAFVIVSIVFICVTTGFFAFRQGWRWAHRQRGWDDAMAACAYIVLLIETVLGGVSAHYGFGKHLKNIKATYMDALFYFYLYQIFYKLLGGFTKLTFCFLYLRIFNQKSFHWLVITVAAISGAGSIAFALGTVFQCTPVNRAWDRTIPGHCTSNTEFWYTHAAFNILFDIVIFILPIPLIQGLKMARGQKTGLISIFCLGAFVIAAATVRMVMLRASAGSTDPTWGSTIALIWTEIEANTSVIVCCLPALRVPFLRLWQRARGQHTGDSLELSDKPNTHIYDDAWDRTRKHHNGAVATRGLTKPQNSYKTKELHSQNQSDSTETQSNNKSEGWYDRVLRGLEKDHKDSDNSSQDGLVHSGAGSAAPTPFGGIFKTTEMRVSTQDVDGQESRRSDPEDRRQVSLKDVLNER